MGPFVCFNSKVSVLFPHGLSQNGNLYSICLVKTIFNRGKFRQKTKNNRGKSLQSMVGYRGSDKVEKTVFLDALNAVLETENLTDRQRLVEELRI